MARIDLKIGGETIPLYFGMVAFEEMQKLVADYFGTNKYAVDVIWAGYINQCAIESLHPVLSYKDIMAKVEEHFFNTDGSDCNLNDVLEAFERSKAGSKLFVVVDEAIKIINDTSDALEEVKKKTTKRKKPLTSTSKR